MAGKMRKLLEVKCSSYFSFSCVILLYVSFDQSFLYVTGSLGIGEVLTLTYLFHLVYLGLSTLFVLIQQTPQLAMKRTRGIVFYELKMAKSKWSMFQRLSEVSICFGVGWSSGKWSQIQVVSLYSSFMFIFLQSRLYQENLEALFERFKASCKRAGGSNM